MTAFHSDVKSLRWHDLGQLFHLSKIDNISPWQICLHGCFLTFYRTFVNCHFDSQSYITRSEKYCFARVDIYWHFFFFLQHYNINIILCCSDD